jgi:hypothetical protein
MAQWRIRVIMPAGPGGEQALRAALAQVPATELQLGPAGPNGDSPAGDVVVELREEDGLPDLLRALHEISPQVFISRVPQDEATTAASGRKIRVRNLRRALSVPA